MAADATTAMTIDFLRARLLSERSVSRAAKERADQLATRVAELEEQLRKVTAQRRKAERAAAEVLAILDSQGFGGASDSGSDDEVDAVGPDAAARGGGGDNARGEAPEDALSGSELGGHATAAQPGGLSWKGRDARPDWERRRPPQQQRGRQLRQRHGHGHRSGYLYSRAADSSPKYHPGQSCRKIKRKELRSQTEGGEGKEDIAGESTEEGQERSDCTVCTDERPDLDGEVSQDGRDSSSNGRVEDGGDRCDVDYGKDGEMKRVLEKQAELIGQYEAEENAQREWERKFSESRDSTAGDVNLDNKLNETKNACAKDTAHVMDREVVCEQARSSENNLSGVNSPSECLPKGSVSGLAPNAAEENAIGKCKVDESVRDFGTITATVASSNVELQVRKDELITKSYPEISEGSGYNLGRSAPSPQGSCDSSSNAGHNKGQGDEDSGSCYHENARSSEHYDYTPSVGSLLTDTPKSEVSEWSSPCFHNHTENQLDTQLNLPSSDDVGGVLEALQRAKMSLREKLSRPSPPSQNILALPPLENGYTKDDFPVHDMQLSLSRSTPLNQEILALQAPAAYLNRILPHDDVNVPLGHAGLFRVPTDSFPRNWMASCDGYGSKFSLTATSQLSASPSYPVNHITSAPSFSQYGSGFSQNPYCYPHSSMLLAMPTAGGCSIPESDFRIGGGSFLPKIPRPRNDSRRVMRSGDAGMLFQYGDDIGHQ